MLGLRNIYEIPQLMKDPVMPSPYPLRFVIKQAVGLETSDIGNAGVTV